MFLNVIPVGLFSTNCDEGVCHFHLQFAGIPYFGMLGLEMGFWIGRCNK
jgi:hypothetical protein